MKSRRTSFSGQDVRGGCAGAEHWITKTNPVRSLVTFFVGHVVQSVHTLLRAVQAPSERGAASWALQLALVFSAVWLSGVPAVPPHRLSRKLAHVAGVPAAGDRARLQRGRPVACAQHPVWTWQALLCLLLLWHALATTRAGFGCRRRRWTLLLARTCGPGLI